MAKGFWVKNSPTSSWKTVKNLYVKISPSTWVSVNDAWVKIKQTGTGTWQRFWASATNPDTPIEILTDFTSPGQLLRLQGKNYHWTPNPSTLFYKFTWVDNATSTTYTLTSSTSTSNPASGSSITLPGSSTYRTISKNTADNEFAIGGLSTYKFTVTGALSNGLESVASAEYSMRTPAAPEIAVEVLSGTSLKLTITPASTIDGDVTGRYIVYTSDAVGGLIESGGGRGGYAYANPKVVTLTGLTAGREYDIYVAPFTGTSGSTAANATGYAGAEGYVNSVPVSDYTFTFGKVLHVGTNGYISLDSGNTADAISSTTGKVLGIFPGDLYQDTTTSVWYWSDENKFIIRWEGYHYNQTANLRQYEVTFTKDTNYVTVYPINVANTTEGTEAYVKNGVALTSYAAALGTGSWRTVYFDPTISPANLFGPYVPKSKSVMKQVTGLTAGTQDQGYTSITTSINQNVTPTLGAFNVSSFTKGTVAASSQGAARSTTLTWGSSTNATRYEIQYQGSNDNTNWTTVQTYGQSAYNTGTTETKTWSSQVGGDFTFYTYMRANIRASESTATAAYVYSDSGSYVAASGVAPGQPTFGTITTTGSTASVPFTVGTTGTNFLYTSIEYMYKTSTGSYPATWSTSVITNGAGTISLSGLSASTTYYIKIRTRNYDELYSSENETTLETSATPGAFTTVSFSKAKQSGTTRDLSLSWNASTNGPNYEVQYEGSSNGTTWTVLQSFAGSTYKTATSDTYTATAYKFYRASVRARNAAKDLGSAAYSDGGTSSSYVYISAAGTSPGKPTIGDITVTKTTASVAYTHPTDTGSATIDWIQFSLDDSTFSNDFTSPYDFSSLTAGTAYTVYARSLNYDGLYSATPNASKTFTTTASKPPTAPTSITAGTKTNTSIAWSWTAPTATTTNLAATGYEYAHTTSAAVPTSWTAQTGTTKTITSLTKNTTYYMHVRATNADGTSASDYNSASTNNDNFYTVTFNVNGSGGTAPDSVTQTTVDGNVTLAAAITRTGYTFGGWNTATDGTGTNRGAGTSYKPTADIELYAKWTVTFTTPSWNGQMPGWTSGNNFERINSPTASRVLKYGWNNGTFSFSGSVGSTKGWDFYVSGTEPSTTTTARTPTHDRAFNETAITGNTVQGNDYMYRVNPTWNINSRYGSIRPYQYGTDGNKYVRSSWSGSI
jgi:hypothetical protein